MVQDLSGSFWDDLPNVQAQFGGPYDALNADGDVQFGVGSFIDKPVGVFGSDRVFVGYDESGDPIYTSDYVYQTNLAVSGDQVAIQDTLDGLDTQYGVDWKEAQLEALVQVACAAPRSASATAPEVRRALDRRGVSSGGRLRRCPAGRQRLRHRDRG